MPHPTIPLREVDSVDVKILMDNTFDMLMTSTDVAKRARLGPNPFERQLPVAEHGFSALITVKQGNKSGTIMFDTGLNGKNLLNNLHALEVDTKDVQAIILSH